MIKPSSRLVRISMQPCSGDRFRSAMRQFAATVSIVTATEGQRRHGMPATSVSSLSVEPPSILVCINQSASMHGPTSRSGYFCVNILSDLQRSFCEQFARLPSAERFAVGDWKTGTHELPYLTGCVASLFCSVDRDLTYGTHTIFVGRVLDLIVDQRCSPLILANGRMRPLGEELESRPPETET